MEIHTAGPVIGVRGRDVRIGPAEQCVDGSDVFRRTEDGVRLHFDAANFVLKLRHSCFLVGCQLRFGLLFGHAYIEVGTVRIPAVLGRSRDGEPSRRAEQCYDCEHTKIYNGSMIRLHLGLLFCYKPTLTRPRSYRQPERLSRNDLCYPAAPSASFQARMRENSRRRVIRLFTRATKMGTLFEAQAVDRFLYRKTFVQHRDG